MAATSGAIHPRSVDEIAATWQAEVAENDTCINLPPNLMQVSFGISVL